ncbi:hypothetical protein BV898_06878 [Hypsibius exemplaris]|uniref:Uncharacterized protein n=1 Tax=Hypsibius exemplaris TaxID=2072580 RepID=A0A1W0WUZ0_HYPEX|nr:hypothetical protein BV898_06878 [Hypsibius exemplaris]
MLEPRERPPVTNPKGFLDVAIRARKYQIGCLSFVLVIGIIQVFFGLLTIPPVTRRQFTDLTWSQISDFVVQQVPRAFFRQKFPTHKPTGPKKWNLTACAIVHNEAAYLIEWMEFHRLQGVQHFVFTPEFDPADYAQNKEWSMVDCNVRYGKLSQWLLLVDAGHFVYSNEYATITDFLQDQTEQRQANAEKYGEEVFTAVAIETVRFGTSGVQEKFQTWLTPNAYTGGAEMNYEPYLNSTNLFPLVIESNPNRAPHHDLDEDFEELPLCSKTKDNEDLQLCSDASVVWLIKAGRCPPANITECLKPTFGEIRPDLKVLRADNHNWRAVNHVKNAKYWDNRHDMAFEALDASWFSTMPDEGKLRFVDPVREAIAKVQPRIFLDVGRECRADAMLNGQQVRCPESHPYPFGNMGLKWLRQCCKTDTDEEGQPLELESLTCFNNSVVDCPDPHGITKWIHRSCCINDHARKKRKKK